MRGQENTSSPTNPSWIPYALATEVSESTMYEMGFRFGQRFVWVRIGVGKLVCAIRAKFRHAAVFRIPER